MPKGPQGQKRPSDTVRCAILVAQIATGDSTEELQEPSGKNKSGQAGSQARATKLTQAERSAIAKQAAQARWKNLQKLSPTFQED